MNSELVGSTSVNNQSMFESKGSQSLRDIVEELALANAQNLIGQVGGVHQGTDEIKDRRVLERCTHRCDETHCGVVLLCEEEAEASALKELRRRSGGEIQRNSCGLNEVGCSRL